MATFGRGGAYTQGAGIVKIALSTNWLSERVPSGEAIAEQALQLGFDGLELGYLLTPRQFAQILKAQPALKLEIGSVHAFCPVPEAAPYGYPELYSPASPEEDERALACHQLLQTLETARQCGATRVVCHAGRVELKRWGILRCRSRLKRLAALDGIDTPAYTKRLALERQIRTRCAPAWMDAMCRSLDHLLPRFETARIALCLENLPSFEAFPDGSEFAELKRRFPSPALLHWHDLGHGEIRARHGWEPSAGLLEKLLHHTGGVHIHDVLGRDCDHLAPGKGQTDFRDYAFLGKNTAIAKVFEPAPDVPEDDLQAGLALIRRLWE